MTSFFDRLNSLTYTMDRLELTDHKSLDVIPKDFTDQLTTADCKILWCIWEHKLLTKNYEPFSVKMTAPLNTEEIRFLELYRLNRLTNPLIRGFYADVMCNTQPKPHGKYAKLLAKDYIEVLINYNRYRQDDCQNVLRSLIYNCEKYKVCKVETRNTVIGYIRSSDLYDKFCTIAMLREYEYLSAQETISLSAECNIIGCLSRDYFANKKFYEILIRCYGSTDKEVLRPLYIALAKNQDKVLIRKPYSVFDANYLYAKYEYLRAAGKENEAQECYEEFMEAKSCGIGLQRFSKTITIPNEVYLPFKEIILTAESPIHVLATDDHLLPPEESKAINPFIDLKRFGVSMCRFDNNGNPHDWEEYEKKHEQLLSYSQSYTLLTLPTIMLSLRPLIEDKKFSFETIHDFLSQTWLSKSRVQVNTQLRDTQESWMIIISPSLKMLCTEIQKHVDSYGEYKGDFVCAIDSLTMKIEGCIRDACRRLNIATVTSSHNEILLEDLLDKLGKYKHPEGSTIISSRTQKMLLAILTKQGWNLRNNIAHGFTSTADYNLQTAVAVLHCLLKVSAIKIE